MTAARHRTSGDGFRTPPGAPSPAAVVARGRRPRSATGSTGSGGPDAARPRHPLVLFDGACGLCSATVRWLIRRDPGGRLRFASLQSGAADRALRARGVTDRGDLPDSLVLIDEAGVHIRSEAALRIAAHLGGAFRVARVARRVPLPLRDAVYRCVARNRARWFGRHDRCMRPPPGTEDRFLDAEADPGDR